jgi:hypothetical protein
MIAPHTRYPYSRHSTKRLIQWLAIMYALRIDARRNWEGQAAETSLRRLYWQKFQNLQIECFAIRRVLEKRSINTDRVECAVEALCRNK